MASRTDKSLLLSAMLGSKNDVPMIFPVTDLYLDIEVEGVVEDAMKRSYYFVSLYVEDIKVAESKKSKVSSSESEVKLEWKNNQLWVML